MSEGSAPPPAIDDETRRVGLCVSCGHARVLTSAKGSTFYRCTHAAHDATFVAYPPLPVRACTAYAPRPPAGRGSAG